MKFRWPVLIVVLLLILCLPGMVFCLYKNPSEGADQEAIVTETIQERSRADKPTGNGPCIVGRTDVSIPRPSMANMLARIFYPATSSGQDVPVAASDAPYATLTWAPGAGGSYTDFDDPQEPRSMEPVIEVS